MKHGSPRTEKPIDGIALDEALHRALALLLETPLDTLTDGQIDRAINDGQCIDAILYLERGKRRRHRARLDEADAKNS